MIKTLRIKNYKSIRDLTLDLQPLTVLIGRSGTGKSNIVKAIRHFRDVLRGSSQANADSIHIKRFSSIQSFEVTFDIANVPGDFRYLLSINTDNNSVENECLNYNNDIIFHQGVTTGRSKLEWIIKPAISPLPEAGGIKLNKLPGLELPTLAYTYLSQGIGYYHFDSMELNTLDPNRTSNNTDVVDYKSILINLVSNPHMIPRKKEIKAAISALNQSIETIDVDSILNVNNAIIGHKFDDGILNYNLIQESDGLRKFLAYLLVLSQPESELKNFVIFEEPENGVYRGALRLLADFLLEASTHRGTQVVITTHSPDLLDHFEAEQIRVVEMHNLDTVAGPLEDNQIHSIRDKMLFPGELLTADEARIGAVTQ
jgi:AAA15 family ATPase/GTPase